MDQITLDIFNDDAFSLTNLTATVNTDIPYIPGQVGKLGVFEEEGITTVNAFVERRDGSLALVDNTPRGGPGETVALGRDNLVPIMTSHLQRDDSVMADEVQGRRAFGRMDAVETVEGLVTRKLARHTRDFDLTTEFMKVGAIKGKVLNKRGGVLVDCYQTFGFQENDAHVFKLSDGSINVRDICDELGVKVEDQLDTNYVSLHAFAGNDFFRALIGHKSVRDAWLWAQKMNEQLGRAPDTITLGPITFERYKMGRKAKDANAGVGFIASDEVRVVPVGVPGLFLTRFAPADYEETVNTPGLPRYAKQWRMENGKGRKMEIQSNPICLCTRPNVLFKGKLA